MLNVNGHTVKSISGAIGKHELTVEMANFSRGVYYVRLIGEGIVATEKIIKL